MGFMEGLRGTVNIRMMNSTTVARERDRVRENYLIKKRSSLIASK